MIGRLSKLYALLGVGTIALAIPVIAQGPESLLPEGFGDPQPAPRAAPPAARPAPPTAAPAAQPAATTPAVPAPPSGSLSDTNADTVAEGSADDLILGTEPGDDAGIAFDLPPSARRSLDRVGFLTPSLGGLGERAFGSMSGRAKARMMAATRAPIVSRWASILLRRALASQSDRPLGIGGADWVAERAWLLLRMGEVDNARLLIQSVDNDRFSKRLYAITMQTYLASADPAGLCPHLPRARSFSNEPSWFMAQAICASFSADQNSATAVLNQAERKGVAKGIDYRLAEKLVGSGPQSRRSVKIEWTNVNRLTTWRFGLATANNVAIPEPLYRTVGQHVRIWEARAPMLSLMQRLPGATTAVRLGVFSGTEARNVYSALIDDPDVSGDAQDAAEQLRTAYASTSDSERIAAMRTFWSKTAADGVSARDGQVSYAALPLIARAAASLKPDPAASDDTPWLLAAMLSTGYDRNAMRWSNIVDGLDGMARQRSWALLATGIANPRLTLTADRIDDFLGADASEGRIQGRFLIAALAGLDRLPRDKQDGYFKTAALDPTPRSRWAQYLMAAANRGEKGTVALLVAAGLQTHDWAAVPSAHLYFATKALRQVGLDPYARMIAAEAMARL